jgi:hypothetical protein
MGDFNCEGDVFGQWMELPTPLFVQGFTLRLFSCRTEDRYLVLPRDRPDESGAYIRCSKPTKHDIARVCDSRFDEKFGAPPETISEIDIARRFPLVRSKLNQSYIARLSQSPERSFEERVALDFSNYLYAVWLCIEMKRDPSLTFPDWVLHQSAERQPKLQEILKSGVLDTCIDLHRRYYLPRV